MAYGSFESRSVGFFKRAFIKVLSVIASSFPHNTVRVWALRKCGFKVGEKVYLGPSFMLATMNSEKSCMLDIRDRVAIGPRVTIVLSSDANWSKLSEIFEPIRGKVVLENDCWLGAGCIILPNVTVGACSIVAAGAVVTKDVPPYHIVAGVPARTIKVIPQ